MTVKTKAVTVLGDKLKSISQKVIEDEKNQGIKKKADNSPPFRIPITNMVIGTIRK